VDPVECDLCVNKKLTKFRHEQTQEEREEELHHTHVMREKILSETLDAQNHLEEVRKQRTRDYNDEMSRIQAKRSQEKTQHEEEKNKEKERIDRLREGIDDLEFQQYASKRKQEYIRDLLDQMEQNHQQRQASKESEKFYYDSAMFGAEDVDSKRRAKQDYKSILQQQMEYKQKEKTEAKQKQLEEEKILQEHAQLQMDRHKEEQERRLREIRKQFDDHMKEESKVKEKLKQERLEAQQKEQDEHTTMKQNFWNEQNQLHQERKVRERKIGETLLKQMEHNAAKRKSDHHEDMGKNYEATILKARDPDLMVCGGCNQTLPVSRFKGTPSHTLIKALQKYKSTRRGNWSTYSSSVTRAPPSALETTTGSLTNTY